MRLCRHRTFRARAFTAIEALVAATILAILTAAVAGALAAGRAQSQLARDMLCASFLGQSMMDEVMRLPFTDSTGYWALGPTSGQTRATYTYIGGYCGYTDGPGPTANTPNGTAITDIAGNPYPSNYQGFARTVTMTAVSTSPTGWNRTLNGLLITVSVTKNGMEVVRLQRIAWQ